MTVKDLIEKLEKQDPEAVIVLSNDEEGNGFSALASIDEGSYDEDTGEYGPAKLSDEDREAGLSDEDIVRGKKAICLWP